MTERKHNDTHVSLSPLPFEEAVKRLVLVLPPPTDQRLRHRPTTPGPSTSRARSKEADESSSVDPSASWLPLAGAR